MKSFLILLLSAVSLFAQTNLAPGTYTLGPGQYGFTVPTPTPTPAPTPSPTPAPTPSADKTTIPPASQIIDSNIDVWTLSGGQCYRDNALAGISANVISMAYVTSKVWQENSSHGWWYWNGTTWIAGPAPLPTPTPSPTPTPVAGVFRFFGGVFDLPNSSWDHYVHAPYTESTQPSGDLLYTLVTTDINTFHWGPVDNDMANAKKNGTPFIWYCGYLNWAAGQGFPANYGYTGSRVVTLFDNLISQAKARYGEADLTKYCYFNYGNECLNSYGNSGNTGNWESAFGGKGSTGCDWVINTGKIVRKYLPSAMIGINDYNVEDVHLMHQYGGGASRLNQLLEWLPKLKNAGVLDWIGYEGYNLESQTSDGLSSSLNQSGAYAPVIYTEFSPGSYDWFGAGEGTVSDPPQAPDGSRNTKVAAWKRLVPLFVNSGHCRGIVGPWVGSPAGGSAIFDGTTDRPAMTWLKSYIPTVIQ